jgi:hypothetical protein
VVRKGGGEALTTGFRGMRIVDSASVKPSNVNTRAFVLCVTMAADRLQVVHELAEFGEINADRRCYGKTIG